MTPYCRPDHVTDLILAEVAEAAEALNADLVARCIADATGEVSSLLARRYRQPFRSVPEIIRWIVSDRGRDGGPPLPPNRACDFPAHGSPVDGFFIETGSLPGGLRAL